MPLLLDLFLTFLKIGAISFGGGYAMIPLLQDEVLSHGWLTNAELMNFIGVSESTPGPVAINMSTFVGYSQGFAQYGTVLGGVLGAFISTFAVVLPSFIIILIIAAIMHNLIKYKPVSAFIKGIRPVVVGLIISAGILLIISVLFGISKISGEFLFDWKALVIFALIFLIWLIYKLKTKKNFSPILLIIISAPLGILFYGLI